MSTGHQFFELKSPRDVLEKARREFARLQADLNTDNVFNFFVTIHHIKDYVKESGITEDQFPKGGDFQLCRKICNSAKHLSDQGKYKDNNFIRAKVTLWEVGLWDKSLWDGSQAEFHFEGKKLDILEIAEGLINEWESFLTGKGL